MLVLLLTFRRRHGSQLNADFLMAFTLDTGAAGGGIAESLSQPHQSLTGAMAMVVQNVEADSFVLPNPH
jgi:hypothetical protein